MAIQPRFAQAILNGDKTVEFRKRGLARDIDTVLIYETAPTQRIVGQFTVDGMVMCTPDQLWSDHGSAGAIDHDDFLRYYAGRENAVGIMVGDRTTFARPVELTELSPAPAAPQSFSYLTSDVALQVLQLQEPALTAGSVRRLMTGFARRPLRVLAGVGAR